MRHILGISFLQQWRPELIPFIGVHEDELSIFGRQSVINAHLNPFSILPKLKAKHPWSTRTNNSILITQDLT